ncbi:MAG: ABC transporter substrate-binding protein [Betaproteobacteria bacterium]|nr:ABC transporter substrate-binding protein [Betaproteobacteria bacterium]
MRALLVPALALAVTLAACGRVWNDPYPAADRGKNILYSAFVERPKHLDPVQSYAEDESRFIQQVYEPPLQYAYLARPYRLVPLTATEVPHPQYLDRDRRPVPATSPAVAYSVYTIHIRPGILYQPHPAFARDASGALRYDHLSRERIAGLASPYALPHSGTRELVSDDYIYEIKRLAHPRLYSPIFGLMSQYIVGLSDLAARLRAVDERMKASGQGEGWIDLRKYPLAGVERVDAHTFRITLKGRYPQFVYWLAMPFFAPVPWEVDKFFQQPGMAAKNFTLDWWPVGTGPYMLTENNPNARMVLERNPNFRGEPYPSTGEPGDRREGLLADAGKTMPFIDKVIFSREKESIPYWNKFLQGYYDSSGVSSDNFDQAVRISVEGEAALTPQMRRLGIQLRTSVATSILYIGFNWLDPVVGGAMGGAAAERARKLRQAISIAVDMEEYLQIFANGRGIVAQGPIPPGIFGYRGGAAGVDPVTHVWRDGAAHRRALAEAKRLLAEAGYPDGRDARTGEPLVLYLDTVSRGPGDKARLDWWRKQFAKLSIQLEVRETDWNRFQEKIRKGSEQIFILGWDADYPDPENFLFLLDGAQSRALHNGENAANYSNPEYDALFERMRNMPDSPERQKLIDRMVDIARNDAPWIWGYFPKDYVLYHGWLSNVKPNDMARNNIKYLRVDPAQRAAYQRRWNRPMLWPLALLVALIAAAVVPAVIGYRRRERMAALPPAGK